MARRRIFVRLAIGLLAAIVMLGVAGAAASPERASVGAPTGPQIGLEFGDAPEGLGVLAYPPLPVPGSFPTCMSAGPGAWVQHTNFGAHFGPTFDLEADSDAGLCQSSTCFPPYDADECYKDNDAGLILPEPFTIVTTGPSLQIVSCPASKGTALGYACQTAFWGGSVDINVTNNMPSGTVGRVNLLVDWNQDGQWSGSVTCPDGTVVPEHVLVNFPVPNGFTGPLSKLFPPNFVIGPNTGHIWSRFSITERDVLLPWSGDGQFEDGESEDYLLAVDKMPEGVKWVQPPSRTLSGLHAHDYVNVTGQHEQITLADDWLCQGGQVTDLHWWGNYELDATQSEHRGAGIDHFHLSIHATDPTGACLPVDPPLWIADVPFGLVAETDTGLVNVEGSKIYKYSYVLPEPFDQIAGHAYWLDITAVSVDPKDPPSWRWQEAARDQPRVRAQPLRHRAAHRTISARRLEDHLLGSDRANSVQRHGLRGDVRGTGAGTGSGRCTGWRVGARLPDAPAEQRGAPPYCPWRPVHGRHGRSRTRRPAERDSDRRRYRCRWRR